MGAAIELSWRMPPTDDGVRRSPSGAQRKSRRALVDQARGSLVLIGGVHAHGDALGCFIRLAGADRGAPVVGFDSLAQPEGCRRGLEAGLHRCGVPHVEIPIVDTRDAANDPTVAAMVREASGIFLGGGDQVHLIATLSGTAVAEAIEGRSCAAPSCAARAPAPRR